MEEDAEGMDRFDMDGDFEGGRFGRDGEFYYERRRERAPQTRDDALYGVFAEGDSDYDSDDGRRRSRRKRRRDEAEPDLSRPVHFQSAGKFMPSKEPEPELEERPGLAPLPPPSASPPRRVRMMRRRRRRISTCPRRSGSGSRRARGRGGRRGRGSGRRPRGAGRRRGWPPGSRRRLWGAWGPTRRWPR